ncbi:MAG: DUF3667 domain-containing protein [Bacteroidaceae bacterium]|nr:DUF3667 domain-containing protein [Bacteroidaceae bacterium]
MLRQRYARFRAWQRHPYIFQIKDPSLHRCANCGHQFRGNYCPCCSQKAGVGRVTWAALKQNIMMVWGMESRSLPYSLVQLLGRPGYFIRDYISGRRQVCFPPVKMLVIVGILVTLLEHLIVPQTAEVNMEATADTLKAAHIDFLTSTLVWLSNHREWSTLIYGCFMIFPTWLMFRKAPAYPYHTMPEGFFVQVLICTIIVIVEPFDEWRVVYPFMAIYYVITYHQLFGYGWWTTIWRLVVTALLMLVSFVLLMLLIGVAIGIVLVITGQVTPPDASLMVPK